MADWQGPLLAFHKLNQAFENDKCRNSDTDFQHDGTFSDSSILLLSMVISSMADWQGPLLAFHKLDQAFENDKRRNSDTDFQHDGTFPLVSSKLNWTRRRKHTKKVTRC